MTPLRLQDKKANDEGSLLMAVLVTIILTSIVLIVTATVITGLNKTRQEEAFALSGEAADAALYDALYALNSQRSISAFNDLTHAKNMTVGGATAKWYATPVSSVQSGTAYDITAIGQYGRRTRTFSARLTGISTSGCPVCGGSNNGGTISYLPNQGFGFGQAIFADQGIDLDGNTTVDSYDSNVGYTAGTTTGHGDVSTNGNIDFNGSAARPLDNIVLWDFQSRPFIDRCNGTPCKTQSNITLQPARVDISTSQGMKFIDSAVQDCLNNGRVPLPWVASQSPGFAGTANLQPAPGKACYSSLDFDRNTYIPTGTTIYVTGSITVRPGVTVNMPYSGAPKPGNLVVYSKGDVVTLGDGSKAAWALWAPIAACSPGSDGSGSGNSNSSADLFGAQICSRVSSANNWKFHYDEALKSIPVQGSIVRLAWSITTIKRQ